MGSHSPLQDMPIALRRDVKASRGRQGGSACARQSLDIGWSSRRSDEESAYTHQATRALPSVCSGCAVEHVAEFFEIARPDPSMTTAPRVRAEKMQIIPAAVHVDDTGAFRQSIAWAMQGIMGWSRILSP